MKGNLTEDTAKLDLRDRILSTALTAFLHEGIKVVTMDDIAARMVMSKRTLYEVFPDKETLLLECIRKANDKRRKQMEEINRNSQNVLEVLLHFYEMKVEDLRHSTPRFYRDIQRYPRVMDYFSNYHETTAEATERFFRRGVDEGIFRTDVNFAIISLLLHEQMRFLLNTDACKAYQIIDVFDSIVLVSIRGFSTPKGQAILEDFLQKKRAEHASKSN